MTRETVNEIFESELGLQLDVIYVTSDDIPFIRYEDALSYVNEKVNADTGNTFDTKITTWYPEDY